MDTSVLRQATEHEQELKLSPQDAHIYSAVLGHLIQTKDGSSYFLNRNVKDFDEPNIVEQLKSYGCKLLASFDNGLHHVKGQLSR